MFREASWFIGPGHASDALRLEVRIEPFDSVMFGRVLAPASLLNDAVQVPRPGNRSPLLVQGLAASWPWARGRLRFKIVRDSAVQDAEEIPKYVQGDRRSSIKPATCWRSSVGSCRRNGLLCLSLLTLIDVYPFADRTAIAQSSCAGLPRRRPRPTLFASG